MSPIVEQEIETLENAAALVAREQTTAAAHCVMEIMRTIAKLRMRGGESGTMRTRIATDEPDRHAYPICCREPGCDRHATSDGWCLRHQIVGVK